MDLVVFSKEELVVVLRALRAVASADGRFTPAEAELCDALARLHGVVADVQALDPISLEHVAAVVVDPHKRKRTVQLAIVMALVEGKPDASREQAVAALGKALDVPDTGLRVLHDLAGDHALMARIDMVRRMGRFLTRTDGIAGLFRFAMPMLGLSTKDPEVEAKFRGLAALPRGTLGRELFETYETHGFKLPGSEGGIPEKFIFHDIGHVISGYDVDPQGEIQQAAFQSGFIRNDGFLFLLFGILQFHVGMKLTPIAEAERGYFDVRRVLQAAARGAACKVDFSDGFDFWAHAAEPVTDLRRRWGVPPLEEAA